MIPSKYIDEPCPKCYGTGKTISPDWLIWKRKQLGLTQRKAAFLMGISTIYLHFIEKGHRRCPNSVLEYYERTILRSESGDE